VDSIQGKVLLGILVKLKEKYIPRVAFQEGKVLLVP
jgi:hypothetical protein